MVDLGAAEDAKFYVGTNPFRVRYASSVRENVRLIWELWKISGRVGKLRDAQMWLLQASSSIGVCDLESFLILRGGGRRTDHFAARSQHVQESSWFILELRKMLGN